MFTRAAPISTASSDSQALRTAQPSAKFTHART